MNKTQFLKYPYVAEPAVREKSLEPELDLFIKLLLVLVFLTVFF